uniref:Uncharacterized protein n=1 Tax=Romanomermis culicivorax TaxID=13658 RepID=A0A915HX93_ROMCU
MIRYPCILVTNDNSSMLSVEPTIINPQVEQFPVVVINDSIITMKVPGKENAFADFLSCKYKVNKTNDDPSTSKYTTNVDSINIVETKAQFWKKTAPQLQVDLEAPKTPEEEKIVDPSDLPNQDPWLFRQQQIIDGQEIDITLGRTCQKLDQQSHSIQNDKEKPTQNLTSNHNEALKALGGSEVASKKRFDEK